MDKNLTYDDILDMRGADVDEDGKWILLFDCTSDAPSVSSEAQKV